MQVERLDRGAVAARAERQVSLAHVLLSEAVEEHTVLLPQEEQAEQAQAVTVVQAPAVVVAAVALAATLVRVAQAESTKTTETPVLAVAAVVAQRVGSHLNMLLVAVAE